MQNSLACANNELYGQLVDILDALFTVIVLLLYYYCTIQTQLTYEYGKTSFIYIYILIRISDRRFAMNLTSEMFHHFFKVMIT